MIWLTSVNGMSLEFKPYSIFIKATSMCHREMHMPLEYKPYSIVIRVTSTSHREMHTFWRKHANWVRCAIYLHNQTVMHVSAFFCLFSWSVYWNGLLKDYVKLVLFHQILSLVIFSRVTKWTKYSKKKSFATKHT